MEKGGEMEKYFYISEKEKIMEVQALDEAVDLLRQGGFAWLNMVNPSNDMLAKLISTFGINPVAIEDCKDDGQIPKIEDYQSNTFFIFNLFTYHNKKFTISEINIFVGKNYLILITHNANDNSKLVEDLMLESTNITVGVDFLLHKIIDLIVDQKFHVIEALEDELNIFEDIILKSPSRFRQEHMMKLKRNLLLARKSIVHEREILVKICRKDSPFVSEKSIYHFRDVYDHLTRFHESIEILREMISALMEIYLSSMNNHIALLANKTNSVMRRLSMITTIFMPLTLLASIGGMSEWSMMTGAQNWKIAYPIFILMMFIIGLLSYWLIRKYELK